MRWKTTLVLLLATIGVGAYVSLYEIRQPLPEERTRLAKQVVDLPEELITQIVLELPQAKLTLARTGTVWRMSPHQLRADPNRIAGIVSAAAPLTAEQVLRERPERPLDPSAYGLRPAMGALTFIAEGRPTTLLIGETTPVWANRYVQVAGRPEIYIVPSDLFDQADQPADSFRDPKLLRFDPWEAQELTVRSGQMALALARAEPGWRLTRPVTDRAEPSEVNTLLEAVVDLQIARVVDKAPTTEQPTEAGTPPTGGVAEGSAEGRSPRQTEWGFDQPAHELTLRLEGESTPPITLLVGAPLPDDPSLLYAKRSDEPSLYAVSAADVESLMRDPAELRARQCFDASPDQLTKIGVEQEGATWTIVKAAAPAEAQPETADTQPEWREAGSDAPALERSRVDALLKQVSELRVTRFIEDAVADPARHGFEQPAGAIVVWTADQPEPQRLVIGAALEDSTARYGRLEARDAIAELPDTVMELLAKRPEQLRPPAEPPSPAPPPPSPQTPPAPQGK